MKNNIKKYDIWLVGLDPTKWSEQAWTRPCLVIQSNLLKQFTKTFIVLPITSKEKRNVPIVVKLKNYKKYWLTKESTILSFQIRTADKTRFIKKIWSLSWETELIKKIRQSLILSLDIDDEFEE